MERVLHRLLDAHLRSVRGSDRPVVRPHRGSRVCDPGFEPFQLSPKGKKLFTQREGDMQSPLTSVDVGPDPDWIPPSTTVGGKVLPAPESHMCKHARSRTVVQHRRKSGWARTAAAIELTVSFCAHVACEEEQVSRMSRSFRRVLSVCTR